VNAWPLAKAAGSLVPAWFLYSVLLYLAENPKIAGAEPEEADDKENMAYRYRSVLSALQYGIVHLFGDYPETDYLIHAKVLHFFGIMVGIPVISTFCAFFSMCFIDFLKHERALQLEQSRQLSFTAVSKIRIHLKRALTIRRAKRASGERIEPPARQSAFKRTLREIASGHTAFGRRVNAVFNWTVILSLLNTMILSLPEVDLARRAEWFFTTFEVLCSVIFILHYLARVLNRPSTIFHFWGVIDLICCLPGLALLLKMIKFGSGELNQVEAALEALSMLRGARILNFHMFHREVHIMGRVFKSSWRLLGIPAYLALSVWLVTSALFMWFENEFKDEGTLNTAEDMGDMFAALYFCCIFLTGEWANVDFTVAASRLCIFYVLVGITLFSIPVGIMVESLQSTLEMISIEEEARAKMLKGAPSAAASDKEKAPSVAAFDKEKAPSVAASDKEKAPSVAASDKEEAPSVAAFDKEKAPSVAASDKEEAPSEAASDKEKAPSVAAFGKEKVPSDAASDKEKAP